MRDFSGITETRFASRNMRTLYPRSSEATVSEVITVSLCRDASQLLSPEGGSLSRRGTEQARVLRLTHLS